MPEPRVLRRRRSGFLRSLAAVLDPVGAVMEERIAEARNDVRRLEHTLAEAQKQREEALTDARGAVAHYHNVIHGLRGEIEELRRLLANATDPENAGDWAEAREVGWARVKEHVDA